MVKLVNRLGEEKILPITIAGPQIPLDVNVPYQPLYGKPGAVKTGKSVLVPRQLTLQGGIYYPDKQQIRQEFDELLPFLMQSPLQYYQHHNDNRYLVVYPVGAPQDWLNGRSELQLRITMVTLDPFWYGPEVAVIFDGNHTVQVGGNVPIHPVVRTIGSVQGLTLVNNTTNEEIVVTGSGHIEVDNATLTCTIDGENRLDTVNSHWLLQGFSLVPGSNQFNSSVPVELVYRPRWY